MGVLVLAVSKPPSHNRINHIHINIDRSGTSSLKQDHRHYSGDRMIYHRYRSFTMSLLLILIAVVFEVVNVDAFMIDTPTSHATFTTSTRTLPLSSSILCQNGRRNSGCSRGRAMTTSTKTSTSTTTTTQLPLLLPSASSVSMEVSSHRTPHGRQRDSLLRYVFVYI